MPSDGTTVTVTVSAARDCTWSARADVGWMQIRSASGQGDGVFTAAVGRNDLATPRSGGIIVNDQRLGITQEGRGCAISLGASPGAVPPGGGRRTLTISTLAGCAWAAESSAPWVVLVNAAGAGPSILTYDVLANTGSAREATITVAGQVVVVSQNATPAAPPCTFAIAPASLNFPVAGGPGTVAVTTQAGCAWTVEDGAGWVTVLDRSGAGSGSVRYTVAPQVSTAARTTTLTIAGRAHTVTQPGVSCTYTLDPASAAFASAGGTGAVQVNTLPGCAWTASSNAGWVAVSTISGTGPGALPYTVQPNTDAAPRTAAVVVGGQTHTVTQAAAPPPCTFGLDPVSRTFTAAAGSGTVRVNTQAGCGWTASSSAPWAVIAAGSAVGTGPGDVSYTVAENTAAASRTALLTIGGQTHTVTQDAAAAPCVFTLNPAARPFTSAGGQGTVRVETAGGCAWTATSSVPWIVVAPASAAGAGTADVGYTVAANTTTAVRSGVVTIGGQAHTVTQEAAAPACTYALAPAEGVFAPEGGGGVVRVTTEAGCGWTAVSSDAWVVVTNANGTGTADIAYTVAAAPPDTDRTATVTVNGQVHTVRQTSTVAPAP